jgi:hypothetical protein
MSTALQVSRSERNFYHTRGSQSYIILLPMYIAAITFSILDIMYYKIKCYACKANISAAARGEYTRSAPLQCFFSRGGSLRRVGPGGSGRGNVCHNFHGRPTYAVAGIRLRHWLARRFLRRRSHSSLLPQKYIITHRRRWFEESI